MIPHRYSADFIEFVVPEGKNYWAHLHPQAPCPEKGEMVTVLGMGSGIVVKVDRLPAEAEPHYRVLLAPIY